MQEKVIQREGKIDKALNSISKTLDSWKQNFASSEGYEALNASTNKAKDVFAAYQQNKNNLTFEKRQQLTQQYAINISGLLKTAKVFKKQLNTVDKLSKQKQALEDSIKGHMDTHASLVNEVNSIKDRVQKSHIGNKESSIEKTTLAFLERSAKDLTDDRFKPKSLENKPTTQASSSKKTQSFYESTFEAFSEKVSETIEEITSRITGPTETAEARIASLQSKVSDLNKDDQDIRTSFNDFNQKHQENISVAKSIADILETKREIEKKADTINVNNQKNSTRLDDMMSDQRYGISKNVLTALSNSVKQHKEAHQTLSSGIAKLSQDIEDLNVLMTQSPKETSSATINQKLSEIQIQAVQLKEKTEKLEKDSRGSSRMTRDIASIANQNLTNHLKETYKSEYDNLRSKHSRLLERVAEVDADNAAINKSLENLQSLPRSLRTPETTQAIKSFQASKQNLNEIHARIKESSILTEINQLRDNPESNSPSNISSLSSEIKRLREDSAKLSTLSKLLDKHAEQSNDIRSSLNKYTTEVTRELSRRISETNSQLQLTKNDLEKKRTKLEETKDQIKLQQKKINNLRSRVSDMKQSTIVSNIDQKATNQNVTQQQVNTQNPPKQEQGIFGDLKNSFLNYLIPPKKPNGQEDNPAQKQNILPQQNEISVHSKSKNDIDKESAKVELSLRTNLNTTLNNLKKSSTELNDTTTFGYRASNWIESSIRYFNDDLANQFSDWRNEHNIGEKSNADKDQAINLLNEAISSLSKLNTALNKGEITKRMLSESLTSLQEIRETSDAVKSHVKDMNSIESAFKMVSAAYINHIEHEILDLESSLIGDENYGKFHLLDMNSSIRPVTTTNLKLLGHENKIPAIIQKGDRIWIYGRDSEGKAQLKESNNPTLYENLKFESNPKSATKISDEIHRDILSSNAHVQPEPLQEQVNRLQAEETVLKQQRNSQSKQVSMLVKEYEQFIANQNLFLLYNSHSSRANQVIKERLHKDPNNLSSTDAHGNTLLHLAVQRGDINMVNFLLEACDRSNTTLLHVQNDAKADPFHIAMEKNRVGAPDAPEILTRLSEFSRDHGIRQRQAQEAEKQPSLTTIFTSLFHETQAETSKALPTSEYQESNNPAIPNAKR